MLETLDIFCANNFVTNLYLFCAIGGTVCFFIFTILAFVLAGAMDADIDCDVSADHGSGLFAVKLFSLNSILSFLMFFGWAGVLFGGDFLGLVGAFIFGVFTMALTAYALKMILKLQDSGAKNESFTNAVGTVYLMVQASPDRNGIVTLNTKNGIREVNATSTESIPSGSHVRIVEHIEGNLYRVEKI